MTIIEIYRVSFLSCILPVFSCAKEPQLVHNSALWNIPKEYTAVTAPRYTPVNVGIRVYMCMLMSIISPMQNFRIYTHVHENASTGIYISIPT